MNLTIYQLKTRTVIRLFKSGTTNPHS
jgi:hypothetical protein